VDYPVAATNANARATAPAMPPNSMGTNHQGGGLSSSCMIAPPM
jgi:hypothetical protein